MMSGPSLNLLLGWGSLLGGVLAGAVLGLFFHKEDWLGGYASFRRRMFRLGHIAFFGMGFVSIFFGLTFPKDVAASGSLQIASWGLIVGLIGMPACCFLAAWKKGFRHLFPLPVVSVTVALVLILLNWRAL